MQWHASGAENLKIEGGAAQLGGLHPQEWGGRRANTNRSPPPHPALPYPPYPGRLGRTLPYLWEGPLGQLPGGQP